MFQMKDELLSWVPAPGGPAWYSTGPGDWAEWIRPHQPNSCHEALWGLWNRRGALPLSREAGKSANSIMSVHCTAMLEAFMELNYKLSAEIGVEG